MLNEKLVEKRVREHLLKRGWILTNHQKLKGIHGVDIKGYHPKWRKVLLIEAKGDNKGGIQNIHNSFWTILGQLLTRMDKPGNHKNRARVYAIAIPKHWEATYTRKIGGMSHGWKLLKPKVFLVGKKVEEKTFTYFLRKKKH